VKGHRLHIRSKLKENEENRDLIYKKALEDQFVPFLILVLGLSY